VLGTRSEPKKVDADQPHVTRLVTDIQAVNINDATEVHQSPLKISQSPKKTLAEIKAEVQSQKNSSVSFVIIGTIASFHFTDSV
jgi:hypothetical protein